MLIKVCGLTRQADVDLAVSFGASMCGFIFHPVSPRCVSPAQAASMESGNMLRVGVFVEQDAEEICRIMAEARLDMAQLHGRQDAACARAVGAQRVIRVIWPARYCHRALLYNELQNHADACACYLLDAGLAGGGSGVRLDWEDLNHLPSPRPWLLAGGLSAENVGLALSRCSPDGVDFNSGVEDAPGQKNAQKLAAALAVAAKQKGNRYLS
ncbi:MAG: phosphoribosylanthranilate isomerase [Desulfovibrio desulfuricans]|uniref:phosphoribosylanthranilate isomerase n=1 Tax=Desulfovibrio sp. WGS1351 TaxID=3366814 RepID=UPI002A3EBD9C|nr:phosphoribosylanthranilate isomerase [Desulfovibrio desulfuricans]